MPPPKKGERRNPKGQPSKREKMAREFAKQAGLEELAQLAFAVKRKRPGAVAKALVDAATDPGHKGQIAAQALLWRLLGVEDGRKELRAQLEVEVKYARKVRVMDMEDADEVVIEPPQNGNGKT
jgi:hypothetical protein